MPAEVGLADEVEYGAPVLLGFGLERGLPVDGCGLEFENGLREVSAFGVGDDNLEVEDLLFRGGGGLRNGILGRAVKGKLLVEMLEGRTEAGDGDTNGVFVVSEERGAEAVDGGEGVAGRSGGIEDFLTGVGKGETEAGGVSNLTSGIAAGIRSGAGREAEIDGVRLGLVG